MVDVIGKIIDIDIKAKGEVSAANDKAKKLLAEAAARKAELRVTYDKQIKTKLELVELQYNKLADEDISKITARKMVRIASIEKAMNDHKAAWGTRIVSEIIDA